MRGSGREEKRTGRIDGDERGEMQGGGGWVIAEGGTISLTWGEREHEGWRTDQLEEGGRRKKEREGRGGSTIEGRRRREEARRNEGMG